MNSTSAAVYGCRTLSALACAIAAASASGLSVGVTVTGLLDVAVERVAVVQAARASAAQTALTGVLFISATI
jgi:hypothetical protein